MTHLARVLDLVQGSKSVPHGAVPDYALAPHLYDKPRVDIISLAAKRITIL